jgi:hypothetical protein
MGQIRSPETSVRNYHYSLCNNPEERGSRLLRSGSLKSPMAMTWNTMIGQETLSIATKIMILMFWVSRTWLPRFHKNCFLHPTDNLPAQTLCAWCLLSPVDGRVAVTDSTDVKMAISPILVTSVWHFVIVSQPYKLRCITGIHKRAM